MNNNVYKLKYLKYKEKYLKLNNLLGGTVGANKFPTRPERSTSMFSNVSSSSYVEFSDEESDEESDDDDDYEIDRSL